MKKKLKVYIIGSPWGSGYARFLSNYEFVENPEEADLAILTGGEDVDPSLYGASKHPTTYCSLRRDKEEMREIEKINPNQLVVGICRGSQFSCVLNGGLLVQNVSNHACSGRHGISPTRKALDFEAIQDQIYEITSTHHQMQYPYNLSEDDYDILFTASPRRSEYYQGDKINEEPILKFGEPEVVLYHREGCPRFLAIQGHPEMIPDSPVSRMLETLIYELLQY